MDYADSVDAERGGRGGLSAAHNKYGVSVLTVAMWRKQVGIPKGTQTRSKDGLFKELADLNGEIIQCENILRILQRKYETLKGKL